MTEQPSVLDYSFGRPNLAQFPTSIVGVCRYLRGSGKALTASEVSQIHGSGRFILLNDETTGTSALGGFAQGVADGAAAGAAARVLGAPTSCAIHPAIDFDEMASQTSTVLAYLQGYHSASGYAAGVYGEADVLDLTFNAGLLTYGYGWQASAWSGGRISAHAGLYQYLNSQVMGGAFVDFNRSINLAGMGLWLSPLDPSGGGVPIPNPVPNPIPEDDMSNYLPLFIAGVTGAPPDGPLQNAYYLVNDNTLTVLHLNGSQFAYHQALADVQVREGVGADCFAGYTVYPLSDLLAPVVTELVDIAGAVTNPAVPVEAPTAEENAAATVTALANVTFGVKS